VSLKSGFLKVFLKETLETYIKNCTFKGFKSFFVKRIKHRYFKTHFYSPTHNTSRLDVCRTLTSCQQTSAVNETQLSAIAERPCCRVRYSFHQK